MANIQQIFSDCITAHHATLQASASSIQQAADLMRRALASGGKILVFGNGGSAADSQHFAAELVNRYRVDRAALAAIALTTDASILTSIANDVSFERVFARQVEALGRAGDVALGISTSGKSANVRAALARAREARLSTVALVGADAGALAPLADVCVIVPVQSTPRVQEVHRTILHVFCELIES